MNDNEKKAFEVWWASANTLLTDLPKAQARYIFSAGLANRDQKAGEAVGHQFQSRDGSWSSFIDQRHYENTLADGTWPIRAIYTAPPAVAQGDPVLYQRRMRPIWTDRQPWTDWETCSKGTFEDCKRVPINADWEYESRALCTESQAVAVNEQLLTALELADLMLKGANMNAKVVQEKVNAAIEAAKVVKGQQ